MQTHHEARCTLDVAVYGTPVPGSPFAVAVGLGTVFTHESDFDTNGVLYHLGTDGGAEAYRNPCEAGRVAVRWSGVSNGTQALFVDHAHRGQYSCTPNTPNSWMEVDLGARSRLAPTHYTLRSDLHNGAHKLRNWVLEGSADGSDAWVALRTHANDAALGNARFSTASWPIEGAEGAYRRFRIRQTGPNSSNHNNLICAGIELYGTLTEN